MSIKLPKGPYGFVRKLEDGGKETYALWLSDEGGGVRVIVDYEIYRSTGEHSRRCLFNKYYAPFNSDRLADDLMAQELSLFVRLVFMPLGYFDETIDGKRYVTQMAELLASDGPVWLWQATGEEDNLLRTPEGDYFLQHESTKDEDYIKPLTVTEAVDLYKRLRNKRVPFDEAFPGVKAEEV